MIQKVCLLILVSIGAISAFPDFYFFSRSAPSVAINVNNGLEGVNGFDRTKETKFLIHGFGDNYKGVRIVKAKDGLLKNTDANIIICDWEKGAAMPWYWYAVDNTRIVGKRLAEFIHENGLDASKVHCIGHSLGAHTCGFVGKNSVNKLARISGLDPAGPWFKGNAPSERLDKNDAVFVDCIHTDNMLGIQDAICQKDYYPNGGGTQAGCGVTSILNIFGRKRDAEEHTIEEATNSIQNEDDDTKTFYKISFAPRFTLFGIDVAEVTACSHLRVMHFFEESTYGNCPFSSTPCGNWSDYKKGKCVCDSSYGCSPMGLYADKQQQHGQFFLYTNKRSLFCQN